MKSSRGPQVHAAVPVARCARGWGLSGAAAPSPATAQPWVTGQPLCVTVMSPVHHKHGPYLSGFRGGSGVTLTAREPVSKRASEMGKCVENTSQMEGKAKAQRPQRRFWCCVKNMGEWLLTFIVILPLAVLCNILLPCILLGILGVDTYKARRANTTKAKGTSMRMKPQSSSGTDPMGEQPRPRAACADSSSKLNRNRHGIGNTEELARSLMQSLDMTEVCLNLLEKLKIRSQDGESHVPPADRMSKYPVCLECRRCVTSGCPHCSGPVEQQGLPLLVVVLQKMSLVSYIGGLEPELDVKMRLIFALIISGKPVYTWEKIQMLPERAPETSCKDCDGSLPTSLWGSECSKAPQPIFSAQGTPEGQTGLGEEDRRAAPDLQPPGQGEFLPSTVSMYPRPPWAQAPSPAALDRLRGAGLEPLPPVGFKVLGQGLSLQCVQHSWATAMRSVRTALCCQCIGSSEPPGTVERDQIVHLDLQRRAHAPLYTTEEVA
ncbi:uncharacterized protein [Patagioenas fasciata]|uniref:uncharacterized protein isoform X1 n=4 Tax=Patagioenas fasciata TaxID=372321 RepID=UPI003A99A6A1